MGPSDLPYEQVDPAVDEPRDLDEALRLVDELRRANANLEVALRSRDVIGQAKGILMATRMVTEDEAFRLLAQASQRTNRKLRELAAEVARTGALPD